MRKILICTLVVLLIGATSVSKADDDLDYHKIYSEALPLAQAGDAWNQ